MPPAEQLPRRRLAAHILLGAVVLLLAIPAYLSLEGSWRAAVVRLICAMLVAIGGLRLRGWVRRAMGAHLPSPLDAAPRPAPPPVLDVRFGRLRDDLASSARSRRYFEAVLWPRLQTLARGSLSRPVPRWGLRRRGPSLAELEELIARIEERS
jgi:hypothetical protein